MDIYKVWWDIYCDFIANLLTSLSVIELWKSVSIWQSYWQKYSGPIFLWQGVDRPHFQRYQKFCGWHQIGPGRHLVLVVISRCHAISILIFLLSLLSLSLVFLLLHTLERCSPIAMSVYICMHVCMHVCVSLWPLAYLQNHMQAYWLYEIFYTC